MNPEPVSPLEEAKSEKSEEIADDKDSLGSFEDLQEEASELLDPKVRLHMSESHQLIVDDHLSSKQRNTKEVDFFKLYSQKKFEFRKDKNLAGLIRESIMSKRSLAMKTKLYDERNEETFEDMMASILQVPAEDKNVVQV